MLNKRFGAAPGGKGTAPEGIREKLERSGSTASKTEQQAQLSPEQRKLLADWQAAKDRCEINRQLTDWIIDFTARHKRAEIAFLYHDCSSIIAITKPNGSDLSSASGWRGSAGHERAARGNRAPCA